MSYSTAAVIVNRLKELSISSTTAFSTTKATQHITEYSARIDARIAKRYQVPVTGGAGALAVLQAICTDFVVADLLDFLSEAGNAENKKEMHTRAEDLRARAERDLTMVETGQMSLSDATTVTSSTFRNSNVPNGCGPVFKKDRRQW